MSWLSGTDRSDSNQQIDLLAEDWSSRSDFLKTVLGDEGLPGIVEDTLDREAEMFACSAREFNEERGRSLSSWELARLLTAFELGLRKSGLATHLAKALAKKVRRQITLGSK